MSLPDELDVISPFVLSYETQNLIFQGKVKDIRKQIMTAFKSLKNKDFVLVGGGADLFDGAILNINTLSLLEDMKAHALVVESWTGDVSADSLYGAAHILGERFMGGVINKVPVNSLNHVKDTVRPFLEKKELRYSVSFKRQRP